MSEPAVGSGVHTIRHAIALLVNFAQDATDEPDILEMIRQATECASELKDLEHTFQQLQADVVRLDALINNPHTANFLEAVRTEAAHQRERWGSDQDAGKSDADWFWLIGYLAGKALHTPIRKDMFDVVGAMFGHDEPIVTKRLHRIITVAAAALNWHAAASGADTRMRPGTAEPEP